MGTMFRMGFGREIFWMGQDGAVPPMPKADRDALLAALTAANGKFKAVEEWRKGHPDPKADLGADYGAYVSFSADERKYGSAAETVYGQLSSDDPSRWTVDGDYQTAALNWTYAVGQLDSILSERRKPAGLKPDAAPAPSGAGPPAGAPAGPTVLAQVAAGGIVAVGVTVFLYAVFS